MIYLYCTRKSDSRRAGRHAGLYHYALLHSSREKLARTAARLMSTSTYIQGASDHGISEAIYLPDRDGNGIELAAGHSPSALPYCARQSSHRGFPRAASASPAPTLIPRQF
jgi:catechol-2,3-dioxygenase